MDFQWFHDLKKGFSDLDPRGSHTADLILRYFDRDELIKFVAKVRLRK